MSFFDLDAEGLELSSGELLGPGIHKVTIAKEALKGYEAVEGWPSEHIPSRKEASLKRFAHLLETRA